jgi:regulator of protease activity HflC (stomatin/prohibitin superfamily)
LEKKYFERRPRLEGVGIIALVLVLIIGAVIFFSVGRVGVGYVVVVVDPVFGSTSAVGDGSNARYFFKPPWASVFKIYVATDSVNMWSEGLTEGDFPSVEALSKDGLKVDVDITVRWRILASGGVDLFRRFPGLDWRERAVIPIIRETVRNLVVNFTAIETIEKRGVISAMMKQVITESFEEESSLF